MFEWWFSAAAPSGPHTQKNQSLNDGSILVARITIPTHTIHSATGSSAFEVGMCETDHLARDLKAARNSAKEISPEKIESHHVVTKPITNIIIPATLDHLSAFL
jgi:hypothetical protein